MKIDTRLTEDDLRITILGVLRRHAEGEDVGLPTLLRELTSDIMHALERGEPSSEAEKAAKR